VTCKKCNHHNPEGNRFCGSCGASLQPQASPEIGTPKNAPVSSAQPTPERNRQLWTPPPAGDPQQIDPLAHSATVAANPAPPRVIAKTEESIASNRTERPAARPPSLGGHSFLGLGIEDDPVEQPDEKEFGRTIDDGRDDGDADADKRDDLYRTNWSGRILVGLVIVAIAGGLAWMQWQSQRSLKASPGNNNNDPAASKNSASSELTSPPASPSTSELEKEQQAKEKTAQSPAQPQNNNAGRDSGVAGPANNVNKAAETVTPAMPPDNASATPAQKLASAAPNPPETAKKDTAAPDTQSKNAASSEAAKTNSPGHAVGSNSSDLPAASSDSNSDSNPKPGSTHTSEASATPAAPASKPAVSSPSDRRASNPDQNSEEPVRLAEIYLTGKGVPQNCDEALGILRTASNRGNERALIKLGALYATGNCVAMDRVAAYRYFTLASKNEPNNTWLEQSRSMLWANMNDSERKQAMEVER
jgi:TPR repeat protein